MGFFSKDPNKDIIIPGFDDDQDFTLDDDDEIEFEMEGETITLEMEDGSEEDFQILDEIQLEGETYLALISADDVEITDDGEDMAFAITFAHLLNPKVGPGGVTEAGIEPVVDDAIAQKLLQIVQKEVELEYDTDEE